MDTSGGGRLGLLVDSVSRMRGVQSIGKSGSGDLPEAGDGDIDLFVFCDEIPSPQARRTSIDSLGDLEGSALISDHHGRFWGTCDFVTLDAAQFCLMYFTTGEMASEIESVLTGERLDKEDGYFYPTGRCATLLSMHVLLDRNGYIASLKAKLSGFPTQLSVNLVEHYTHRMSDVEDLERAVSRSDVLFYHCALESAIDHFLQALFAVNECYFPSRKRTAQYVERFALKPTRCVERLLRVVELGGSPRTLDESYRTWTSLAADHAGIAKQRAGAKKAQVN